jgi:hypothetical protein
VQPAWRPVLREEPPIPVKWVTCGLLFRTGNDLDWHIREEHLQKRDAAGQGRARRGPRARGRWRGPGRWAAASRGRRVRARRDRGGASRSPVVAQAVRPATGTPVGAGSRRRLARDPCPRAAFELRQPADVVLVEMGQHRSSHIGEVVADGLQPGGERIAGADVEARRAVVEESQVAPPGK